MFYNFWKYIIFLVSKNSPVSFYNRLFLRLFNKKRKILFFGKKITILDSVSFLDVVHEIYFDRNYEFKLARKTKHPLIIDVGANIGISTIYFKMKFPEAEVIAFEPDPKIFKVLKENVSLFSFSKILLKPDAVWIKKASLKFITQGGLSGRLSHGEVKKHTIDVNAVLLKDYLRRRVDFLNLDVEGAETDIIKDCADCLCHVDKIYIEYHSIVGEKQSLDEILSILRKCGFKYYIKSSTIPKRYYIGEKGKFSGDIDNCISIYAFNKKQNKK